LEQLPATLGSFDLVVLDETSQSDAREIPALLRGKKVLVVDDDRQVSPGAAFISIANIQRLRANYPGQPDHVHGPRITTLAAGPPFSLSVSDFSA
jgi:superfamily I DNA and/or RNA helicase